MSKACQMRASSRHAGIKQSCVPHVRAGKSLLSRSWHGAWDGAQVRVQHVCRRAPEITNCKGAQESERRSITQHSTATCTMLVAAPDVDTMLQVMMRMKTQRLNGGGRRLKCTKSLTNTRCVAWILGSPVAAGAISYPDDWVLLGSHRWMPSSTIGWLALARVHTAFHACCVLVSPFPALLSLTAPAVQPCGRHGGAWHEYHHHRGVCGCHRKAA